MRDVCLLSQIVALHFYDIKHKHIRGNVFQKSRLLKKSCTLISISSWNKLYRGVSFFKGNTLI